MLLLISAELLLSKISKLFLSFFISVKNQFQGHSSSVCKAYGIVLIDKIVTDKQLQLQSSFKVTGVNVIWPQDFVFCRYQCGIVPHSVFDAFANTRSTFSRNSHHDKAESHDCLISIYLWERSKCCEWLNNFLWTFVWW